ncbi:MAG: efflux transporter outer membrane subunit [Gammaproteobacteria bacterium]|nr:efflux transporter outer membrane subunit [Gammaproteobacteria bacterium]
MFISGCTVVGPDYVKPEVDVPDNWRMEVKTSAAMANVEWWHSFNDPVLDKLIDTALRNNQDVRLAAARVAEFAARVDIARAGFFPQLGYSGDGNRNQLSRESYNGPSSGSRTYNSYTAGLNIGWELDFWGKVARATEASRADLLAAEEGRKVVILTLISSVASNYLQLQSLDEQLIIAKDTVKRREQSVVLFQDKFKGGVISELEVAQVQSEYELARVRIPAIERQIVLLENALSVLIGQNPGSINRTSQSDEVTFPAIPEEIPSDILSQRPDILEAENNLIAANARIGVAKAAYFPTISLTGMLGFASESLSSLLNSSAGVWSAGGSMLGPIFSGGSIDAQLRASEAEQKQLVAQYIKSIQTALMEVEDALISVKKLKEEFNAQSRQVEALKSYSHFAQIRYNDGYVSYIEVLDSERSLFDAELELVRKQGEVLVALVSVYKSMGGGWINEAEKVANETDFPKSGHEKNDGDRQPFPSITLPTTLSE